MKISGGRLPKSFMIRRDRIPARPKPYARRAARRFRAASEELKFFDTAVSFSADLTAEIPATGQLSLIPQGDTQSARDGRKAVIKSIYFHGTARIVPAAAATVTDVLHMYMIQDTQCNGAAATVADANTGIFTDAILANANSNLSNSSRFKILKHFVLRFNPSAGVTGAYNQYSVPYSFYKKCEIPIEYDGSATTGALTTIRSNNIFLVAGSTFTDDLITVDGSCRLRFVG